MKDEEILDEYIAKTTEQPKVVEEKEPTEEEIVEKKSREGRPTPKSVLQKRTELSEVQLDKEMDSFLNKNAGKIDEEKFRADVAAKLEEKGYISKADLASIEERHLSDYESSQTQEEQPVPVVSPPPLVANSLDVAREQAGRAADWASSLRTPGGIGVLLMVLFFFIWVIVPVSNGKTRMQLLWGVLTGQVQFRSDIVSEEENAIQAAVNFSQGSTNGTGTGGSSVLVPYTIDFGDDYGMG